MEILGKILGSPAKLKIMRLFLLNTKKGFTTKEIAQRSRVSPAAARTELKNLASVGFIKRRTPYSFFNPAFKYAREIEALLINTDTIDKQSVADSFKKVGKVKLILISGLFIKNKDSRVDLLIVGDKMKRGKIDDVIRKFEAEIGAELVYAVFNTKEFIYRVMMYDKLVRDILDFPHEVVLQAKELSTSALKKA